MDGASSGHDIRGGKDVTGVKFDFSEFDLLPGSKDRKRTEFTPEMDEALRRYWPVKVQEEVARKLGLSKNTCRRRYRELTEKEGT